MNFPYFFIPQYSISNAPQINTYSSENVRLAEAIVVPFADFLPGAIVADGTADYSDQMIDAVDQLNQLYLSDGFERMLEFPEGTFYLNMRAKSGVGLKGQGIGKTIFQPPNTPDDLDGGVSRRNVVTRHDDRDQSNNLFWDFEIDASNIPFSHIATYGQPFYRWKGFDWSYITDTLIKSVKSANTLGTSFGIDVMNRVYLYDCISTNSGRGVTTAGESGPGAGFGITSGSAAAHEVLEFYRCKAYGCKTAGFYFERALTGQHKPTGHKMVDCEAYGNFIGIDNNACNNLEVEGGRFHRNEHSGYQHGANRTTNYNQGPLGATFTNVEIDRNGTFKRGHGGVHFGYSINRAVQPLTFHDCDIHDNYGGGLVATGDGLTTANDFLEWGEVPRVLRLTGSTSVRNNGNGGLVLTNPKNNQLNQSSITASEAALLEELTIESTVTFENNARDARQEVADAVLVQLDATDINIAATFVDGNAQGHSLALRGNYNTSNLTVSGDMSGQSNYSPIVNEHTVTTENITATLDATRPTSIVVTNYFIDPQLVGATMPTLTGGTGAQFTQAQPIAGLTQNYRVTASATSLTFDFNALVGTGLEYGDRFTFSFYAKTSNTNPIKTAFDTSPHVAGVGKQAVVELDNTWKRYSFNGVYLTSVDLKMVLSGLSVSDTVDIQGLMLLDATIQPEYFDGGVNGGAWAGAANASLSSKTVSV